MEAKEIAKVLDFIRQFGVTDAKIEGGSDGLRISAINDARTVMIEANIYANTEDFEMAINVPILMKILKAMGKAEISFSQDEDYLIINTAKGEVKYIPISEVVDMPEFKYFDDAKLMLYKDDIKKMVGLAKVLGAEEITFSTIENEVVTEIEGDFGEYKQKFLAHKVSDDKVRTQVSYTLLKPLSKYDGWLISFGNETPIYAEYDNDDGTISIRVLIAPMI